VFRVVLLVVGSCVINTGWAKTGPLCLTVMDTIAVEIRLMNTTAVIIYILHVVSSTCTVNPVTYLIYFCIHLYSIWS